MTFTSEIYFPYISFSFKNDNSIYETHLSKSEENIQLIFFRINAFTVFF